MSEINASVQIVEENSTTGMAAKTSAGLINTISGVQDQCFKINSNNKTSLLHLQPILFRHGM